MASILHSQQLNVKQKVFSISTNKVTLALFRVKLVKFCDKEIAGMTIGILRRRKK